MNNNQLAEAAKILGVSEDSIFAMDDEIKNSMTAVFEQVAVKNSKGVYIRRYGLTAKQKKILTQFGITESYLNKLTKEVNKKF